MTSAKRKDRVLIVDDEASIRLALSQILEDEGYEVLVAGSGEEGIQVAAEGSPDVVFLDIWLPGIDGIEALRTMRERGVFAPVVMISGHGTIETAVRATKLGAYDFVEKPVGLERVLLVTSNALRHARLERRNRALRTELRREAEFLGRSASIERLREACALATDGAPVLLFGEKGTGRRLAARWLALHGPRPEGPFLDVQASALPRERLVRALFGEEGTLSPGSPGRVSLVDEGTLYLENADTLPPIVQSSLTAGYRDGRYPAPGTRRSIRSDFQLVLALLEAPEVLAEAGKLSDEFLGMFRHTIEIPPLRDRREDLGELAERFIGEICREYARAEMTLRPDALNLMLSYHWPGNVRELKRVLERAVLLAPGHVIGVEDLPAHFSEDKDARPNNLEILQRFERGWLERHLEESGNEVERAAKRLGLSLEDMQERLRRLGLDFD